VSAVLQCWGHLDLAPRLLMVHMALVSLDPPGRNDVPPCLYWGGWELQATAMHYPLSDTARRRLKRLRLALVEAGAIVLEAKGTRARSARWLVHPMPVEEHSPPLPWLTEKERGSW